MTRKLGIGGAFTLLAVAAGVGCNKSSSGNTIISGGSGDVTPSNFNATPPQTNNLAPDGAGLSASSANVTLVQGQANIPDPTDDNAIGGGDIVLQFQTKDNPQNSTSPPGLFRTWITGVKGNGTQLFPPVEIQGVDRDDNDTHGLPWTNVNATVMLPLNTSSYKDSSGTSNSLVSANTGDWLIVWDAETFTQTTTLNIGNTVTNSLAASDVNGAHHTIYATMLIAAQEGTPETTTNLIGNTATSGAANGATQTLEYGVQVRGIEIPTNRGGASAGLFGGNPGIGFAYRPAEDVISFGAASDTLRHTASFNSQWNNNASTTINQNPTGLSQFLSFKKPNETTVTNLAGTSFITGLTAPGSGQLTGTLVNGVAEVVPAVGGMGPGFASYGVGDATTFIQLFWVQLVTSHAATAGSSITLGSAPQATIQSGPAYRMFTANFNLASLSVQNVQQVSFPAQRTGAVIGNEQTQALPDFAVNNNCVFWHYVDGSFASVEGNGTIGIDEATVEQVSSPMAVLTVAEGLNGTASPNLTAEYDVTQLGTGTKHQTITNSTTDTGTAHGAPGHPFFTTVQPVDNGDEVVFFPNSQRNNFNAGSTPITVGSDEGDGDVTAFFEGKVTTNKLANKDEDWELWCTAVLSGAGATQGTPVTVGVGSTDSLVVSAHQPEPDPDHNLFLGLSSISPTDTVLRDDVFDEKAALDRDGTYLMIGYRQSQTTSINQNLALVSQVYKCFRALQASSQGGTVVSTTGPNLNLRFPTTAPQVVNTAATVAYAAGVTNPSSVQNYVNGFSGPPVEAWQFQGSLGYHTGFQSDVTKMTVLWAYADGSGDRVFVKTLQTTIGATAATQPTYTLTGETELETGNLASGVAILAPPTSSNLNTILRTTFSFIPGSVVNAFPGLPGNANYGAGTGNPGGGEVVPFWNANGGGIGGGPVEVSNSGLNGFQSIDAGPDASGNRGGVVIFFNKVTDATTVDGNFFNQTIVADLYNNTTVAERDIICRQLNVQSGTDIGENSATGVNGLGIYTGGFGTSLVRIIGVPTSAALNTTNGSGLAPADFSPTSVYVYLNAENNDNASGGTESGLYTRALNLQARGQSGSTATLASLFTPAADVSTTGTKFAQPTEIDNQTGTTAVLLDVFHASAAVTVVFAQDNHLWGTVSSNGTSYTSQGGHPQGQLIDDESTTLNAITPTYAALRRLDTSGNDLHGSAIFYVKQDESTGALRLHVRFND